MAKAKSKDKTTVRVRMLRSLAGPSVSLRKGRVLRLEETWARSLAKGGALEILPDEGEKK